MGALCKDCSPVKVEVTREYVRRDGYTKRGTYYGYVPGTDVYGYIAEVPYQDRNTGEWDAKAHYGTVRAGDMSAAKSQIKKLYPTAKFVR